MAHKGPGGLLVLYDEEKGIRKPQVKVFNPSPRVEKEVNEWIAAEEGIVVHRVDWVPSGGLLGASVTFSRGNEATQSIRLVIPGLERLEKRIRQKKPLESVAMFLLFAGVALGLLGMALFSLFYPDTWYGEPNSILESQTAIKYTVLTTGLGVFLLFAGVAALFRARIM